MAQDNPLWGAPRIHGELLKLGFDVSQSAVSKYLGRCYRPRGQSWKTFIANHKDAIAAVDLFVAPTAGFKLLYGLVVLYLKRRELVWTNATFHPTAAWIANQVSQAFPWETAPRYLTRDRDASYGKVFKRRLDAMGNRGIVKEFGLILPRIPLAAPKAGTAIEFSNIDAMLLLAICEKGWDGAVKFVTKIVSSDDGDIIMGRRSLSQKEVKAHLSERVEYIRTKKLKNCLSSASYSLTANCDL